MLWKCRPKASGMTGDAMQQKSSKGYQKHRHSLTGRLHAAARMLIGFRII